MNKVIDIEKLKGALRSDVLGAFKEDCRFVFKVVAFHKDYERNGYQGAFDAAFFDYDTALSVFDALKGDKNFKEVQLRAYGFYGLVPEEGRYDILQVSRPDGYSYRQDAYDK